MKKLICIVLCITMILGSVAFALAETASGTTLSLAKVEGKVTVKNQAGKAVSNKDGMKLYDGYTVATDNSSYAYISLDSKKAIKLDVGTEVGVSKAGKKLEISISKGQIYFNVEDKLKADESMNIRTNTMVTGIRGTKGVHGTDYVMIIEGLVESRIIGNESVFVAAGERLQCTGIKVPAFIDNSNNQNEQVDEAGLKMSVIPKLQQVVENWTKDNFTEEQIPAFVPDDAVPEKGEEVAAGNLKDLLDELEPAVTNKVLTPPVEETGGGGPITYTITLPADYDTCKIGFVDGDGVMLDGDTILKTLTVNPGETVQLSENTEADDPRLFINDGQTELVYNNGEYTIPAVNSNVRVTIGYETPVNNPQGLLELLNNQDMNPVFLSNEVNISTQAGMVDLTNAGKLRIINQGILIVPVSINNNSPEVIIAEGTDAIRLRADGQDPEGLTIQVQAVDPATTVLESQKATVSCIIGGSEVMSFDHQDAGLYYTSPGISRTTFGSTISEIIVDVTYTP